MSLFTKEKLRNRVRDILSKGGPSYESGEQKARRILKETFDQQSTYSTPRAYDIFLSHSSSDAELVAGLKIELEELGYTVYVDWIEDPQLDRSKVTKNTANLLRQRMRQCKSLIYAFSENASSSKWMPWELGYFDAYKGKVAILPIADYTKQDFNGSEYLGIYYYIQIDQLQGSTRDALWVHETSTKYVIFNSWLSDGEPKQR